VCGETYSPPWAAMTIYTPAWCPGGRLLWCLISNGSAMSGPAMLALLCLSASFAMENMLRARQRDIPSKTGAAETESSPHERKWLYPAVVLVGPKRSGDDCVIQRIGGIRRHDPALRMDN
jgi:hypothetical protein